MFGVFLGWWGWDDEVLEGHELILDEICEFQVVLEVSCRDTYILIQYDG